MSAYPFYSRLHRLRLAVPKRVAIATIGMVVGVCWAQVGQQPSDLDMGKQPMARSDVAGMPALASSAVVRPGVKPVWVELTTAQQQALKPLGTTWNGISQTQRRKWLAISQNFEKLPVAEQAKLHAGMVEWAGLSIAERSQARLNFAETKKLSSDEKQAKWQAYQALSAEERARLAEGAPRKLMGAATAVKPAAKPRLTIPTHLQNQSSTPKIATAPHQVDQNTLLPQMVGPESGFAPPLSH